MRKEDNESRFDDIFESMKGSRRAKPSSDLFAKIEAQIDNPEAKVIPMTFRRLAAAAAVLLLLMNGLVLQQFAQNESFAGDQVTSKNADQSLISNYKIYE